MIYIIRLVLTHPMNSHAPIAGPFLLTLRYMIKRSKVMAAMLLRGRLPKVCAKNSETRWRIVLQEGTSFYKEVGCGNSGNPCSPHRQRFWRGAIIGRDPFGSVCDAP
jgi:hypothetical protein